MKTQTQQALDFSLFYTERSVPRITETAAYEDCMAPWQRYVKRAFDAFSALVALVVFSPVCLVIACAIKLEDPRGTVLFRQERIGRKGRPFTILKFRSMAEPRPGDIVRPELATREKSRLTRVGAFIRAHHLDEFPQLINVLKGDMSFVGPRPERKYFIDKIMAANPAYVHLYKIRPGLFSYATLYNGYTDTMPKMLRRLDLDLYYLSHRSWWLDASIILKTGASVLFGKVF